MMTVDKYVLVARLPIFIHKNDQYRCNLPGMDENGMKSDCQEESKTTREESVPRPGTFRGPVR